MTKDPYTRSPLCDDQVDATLRQALVLDIDPGTAKLHFAVALQSRPAGRCAGLEAALLQHEQVREAIAGRGDHVVRRCSRRHQVGQVAEERQVVALV